MISAIFFFVLLIELLLVLYFGLVVSSQTLQSRFRSKWIKKVFGWLGTTGNCLRERPLEANVISMFLAFTTCLLFVLGWFKEVVDFSRIFGRSSSPVLFNMLMTLILALLMVCFTLVKNQLLTPFQQSFNRIDRQYFGTENNCYATVRCYITEMLANVEKMANQIINEITQGNIFDDGWQESDVGARHYKLCKFLGVDHKIQTSFVHLDKHRDYENALIKDVYVEVLSITYNKFLSQIANLVNDAATVTPEFAADTILEAAGRMNKVTGLYATSLLSLPQFYELYRSTDISGISSSRETQRVLVIPDVTACINAFVDETKKIGAGNTAGLPVGMKDIFKGGTAIPHLFWLLEWHWKNNWQLFLIEKSLQQAQWKKALTKPSYPDFLVVNMQTYDLVLAVDTQRAQPIEFFNKTINGYNLTAAVEFHDALRAGHKHFVDLRQSGQSCEDMLADRFYGLPEYNSFKAAGTQGSDVSLADVVKMFAKRSADEKWVVCA